jgi:fructoselysine-6-phosphate deglycase
MQSYIQSRSERVVKFDEQRQLKNINGALALRGEIEGIVDAVFEDGFDGFFFVGIGGTWASSIQVATYMAGKSKLPVYAENAAELVTNGNRRLGPRSVVAFSSVTGSTEELVQAIDVAKKAGARILGFVDDPKASLAKKVDFLVSYPTQEQLKFLMVALRLMYKNGEFPEYERCFAEFDAHLAGALVAAEKAADEFGAAFAKAHRDDAIHYFVGAGTQWGATYSYAMCFWEEQHWLRARPIHAGEFFHGLLEVIDRDTPVTVFLGEDAERPLAERVKNFLPRICGNYTFVDSKDYALDGISPEFRGAISHLVMRVITARIDAHLEIENRHPTEIRRYYRRLSY